MILHTKQLDGENIPLAENTNGKTYYFDPGRFDGREYYVYEIEDTDEEIKKRAGGERGYPKRVEKFEEGLSDMRRQIRRQ